MNRYEREGHRPIMTHQSRQPPGVTVGIPTEVNKTYGNIVVLSSPSGGIGLSVLSTMLAWELKNREQACALVDADFPYGGLDLVLGIEHEEGIRFSDIEAPLGKIEGEALNHELPMWEEVGVLAFDSWNGAVPEVWEVQAAVRALADVNAVVVVDGGDARCCESVPELASARHIIVSELSVLGLARTKAHIDLLEHMTQHDGEILAVVGVQPRGTRSVTESIDVEEASSYLGRPMVGMVRMNRRLQRDVLAGLGIQGIVKTSRFVVDALADRIEQQPRGSS